MSKIYFCICHVCHLWTLFIHFKNHTHWLSHKSAMAFILLMYILIFYFWAPLVLPFNVSTRRAPQWPEKYIFVWLGSSWETTLVDIFTLPRYNLFLFCHFGHFFFFFGHITKYVTVLVCILPTGWVCLCVLPGCPTLCSQNQSKWAFYLWKKVTPRGMYLLFDL